MADNPVSPLGQFIREQRHLARLSLRELAAVTRVSNAYLSQVERGLHAPSVRVLRAVADALAVPVEDLVSRSGTSGATSAPDELTVEQAIRRDSQLSTQQKETLLNVYRSFVPDVPGADLTTPET